MYVYILGMQGRRGLTWGEGRGGEADVNSTSALKRMRGIDAHIRVMH